MFYRSIFILTDSSSYSMYNMMWTKPIFFLDWGLYSSSQYRYKIYWRFGIGVFHVQHAIGAYFSWFAPLCPGCLHLSTATTITDDSRSSNLGNSQKVDSWKEAYAAVNSHMFTCPGTTTLRLENVIPRKLASWFSMFCCEWRVHQQALELTVHT